MFLLNSRLGLLTAAPRTVVARVRRAPLFPKLRGYFAEFLNVVSPAHLGLFDPSTCVGLRYGSMIVNPAAFLGGMERASSPGIAPGPRVTDEPKPARLHPNYQSRARRTFRVPAGHVMKSRNVRLMSISYAFPPRLRDRLTLGGRTWPRKPWICGGEDSHFSCRYSCLHGRWKTLQSRSRSSFAAVSTLSYQSSEEDSAISAVHFSPDHFRRGDTRPVGYYAIFK